MLFHLSHSFHALTANTFINLYNPINDTAPPNALPHTPSVPTPLNNNHIHLLVMHLQLHLNYKNTKQRKTTRKANPSPHHPLYIIILNKKQKKKINKIIIVYSFLPFLICLYPNLPQKHSLRVAQSLHIQQHLY